MKKITFRLVYCPDLDMVKIYKNSDNWDLGIVRAIHLGTAIESYLRSLEPGHTLVKHKQTGLWYDVKYFDVSGIIVWAWGSDPVCGQFILI